MIESDRFSFEAALRLLAAATKKNLDSGAWKETAKAYFHGLLEFDLVTVETACQWTAHDQDAWPSLHQLRETAKRVNSAKGGPVVEHNAQAAAESSRRAKELHDSGEAIVFVALTGTDGGYLLHRGERVLYPQPFPDKLRAHYRSVCDRLPEWLDSPVAKGPIPPCIATYLYGVENCTEPKVQECAWKIMKRSCRPLAESVRQAIR